MAEPTVVAASAARARPMTDTDLRATLARLLDEEPDAIAADANLFELGLDSIDLMEVVDAWRKSGVDVGFDKLVATPTLAAWSALLSAGAPAAVADTATAADPDTATAADTAAVPDTDTATADGDGSFPPGAVAADGAAWDAPVTGPRRDIRAEPGEANR